MHFRTGLGLGSRLGFRLGLGFRCESALVPVYFASLLSFLKKQDSGPTLFKIARHLLV